MQFLLGKRTFLILLFGALLLMPRLANEYHIFIANLVMLYIILSLGLNMLIGFADVRHLPRINNTRIRAVRLVDDDSLDISYFWRRWFHSAAH